MQLALGDQTKDMVGIDSHAWEVEALHKELSSITVRATQFWINVSSSMHLRVTYLLFIKLFLLTVLLVGGWIDAKPYSLMFNELLQAVWSSVVCF